MNKNKYFDRKYHIRNLLEEFVGEARKEKIAKIANEAGISESYLRRIAAYKCTDTAEPKPSTLKSIANSFNITIDQLINEPKKVSA